MAQELDVNAHRQAYKERKSGPIYLPESLQDTPTAKPWWSKYFEWERNLTVAGKVIEKGWVVPQPLGIALLVIIIGGVGGLYWRIIDKQTEIDRTMTQKLQDQRDMLIEMRTALKIKSEQDQEFQRKQKEDDQLQDMQIQNLKDKVLVLNSKR